MIVVVVGGGGGGGAVVVVVVGGDVAAAGGAGGGGGGVVVAVVVGVVIGGGGVVAVVVGVVAVVVVSGVVGVVVVLVCLSLPHITLTHTFRGSCRYHLGETDVRQIITTIIGRIMSVIVLRSGESSLSLTLSLTQVILFKIYWIMTSEANNAIV